MGGLTSEERRALGIHTPPSQGVEERLEALIVVARELAAAVAALRPTPLEPTIELREPARTRRRTAKDTPDE